MCSLEDPSSTSQKTTGDGPYVKLQVLADTIPEDPLKHVMHRLILSLTK